jgi:hypothetical protein
MLNGKRYHFAPKIYLGVSRTKGRGGPESNASTVVGWARVLAKWPEPARARYDARSDSRTFQTLE